MTGLKHKFFAIVLAGILMGCSGNKDSAPQPTAATPVLSISSVTDDLQAALCDGDYAKAASALSDGDFDINESAFWRGYILEMSGKAMHASAIYETLHNQHASSIISLTCNGQVLAGGPAGEEASKRLAVIKGKLLALDANFNAPLVPTHAGLPRSTDPIESNKPAFAVASKPTSVSTAISNQSPAISSGLKIKPLIVEVPPSQSNTGAWFAHFSSYSSSDNADSYLAVLEGKYAALSGVIEKWQISSASGTAWRLGVRANEWSDVDRLCVVIRSKGDYCRVIDTNQ